MLADAVCVGGCWAISVLVYHAFGGGYEPRFYLQMWPVIPAFLAVNVLFRLYHGRLFYPGAPFSPVEEMRRLVGSALLVHIGVLALLALTRQTTEGYSRVVIVTSGILIAGLSQSVRDVMRRLLKALNFGQTKVMLIGSAAAVSRLSASLRKNAYIGFVPVGWFSDEAGASLPDLPRLGGLREVVAVSSGLKVRTALVCESSRLFKCQLQEFRQCFLSIEYIPEDAAFPVIGSHIVSLDGWGGIEFVSHTNMASLRIEKWLMDKVLALIVFVLLMPVIVVLGILVKLTSPGPVFFKHRRLGLHGRPIDIWKFRTMYVDAERRLADLLSQNPDAAEEWKRSFKLKNDSRVTPLGKVLRMTSLDEIPQIFNVLMGSMALVGPRPIVDEEKKYYGGAYEVFSSVTPGMTGLWQVSGRSDTDYVRRVALDCQYVLNWSPWLDIWILFRTIGAVLTFRGAR